MNARTVRSVGIDIGTTTTRLVFSELQLRNLAGMTQAPRYAVTDRRILFRSQAVFTPLHDRTRLDAGRLAEHIRGWYAEAGMSPAAIESGAVIITGESLKASNARAVVMEMTAGLGDFVVASAGPHLESVLAGKGAGAAARSLAHPGPQINIDVGGGTSNVAVFVGGKAVDSACLNVGGRLVETDAEGNVLHVSEPAGHIVRELFGPRMPTRDDLPILAARMADMIYGLLTGTSDALSRKLLQTPPLKQAYALSAVSLSGGVGACCADGAGSPFRFGDMGPLLATALQARFTRAGVRLEPSEQAAAATVIGAGAWSLALSGGTVWTRTGILPLRNVPAALVQADPGETPATLARRIDEAVARLDLGPGEPVVVAFPSGIPVTYAMVRLLAGGLHTFYRQHPERGTVLVAIEDDMGKALGMELYSLEKTTMVVIDEVHLDDGDYLDMGRPLHEGGVVPLTVKSLAFPAGQG